jgi:hypothetical protein
MFISGFGFYFYSAVVQGDKRTVAAFNRMPCYFYPLVVKEHTICAVENNCSLACIMADFQGI